MLLGGCLFHTNDLRAWPMSGPPMKLPAKMIKLLCVAQLQAIDRCVTWPQRYFSLIFLDSRKARIRKKHGYEPCTLKIIEIALQSDYEISAK